MNSPNWTDVLQAFAAAAGAIFLIINFIYLHRADKQQAKQLDLIIRTTKDELIPHFSVNDDEYDARVDINGYLEFDITITNIGKTAKKVKLVSCTPDVSLGFHDLHHGFLNSTISDPIVSPGKFIPFGVLVKYIAEDANKSSGLLLRLTFESELNIRYQQLILASITNRRLFVDELGSPSQIG